MRSSFCRAVAVGVIALSLFGVGGASADAGPVQRRAEARLLRAASVPAGSSVWTRLPWALHQPRMLAGVAADRQGRLYAIGGTTRFDFGYEVGSAERLDRTGWRFVAPLPTPSLSLYASLGPRGWIYTGGGFSTQSSDTQAWWAFDPAIGEWVALPRIPGGGFRFAPAIAALRGRIYAVGGEGQRGILRRVDVFNPWTHTWQRAADMPEGRYGAPVIGATDGNLYVMGGETNPRPGSDAFRETRTILRYDPTTDTWSTLDARLLHPTTYTTSAGELHGHIYLGDQMFTPSLGIASCTDPSPGPVTESHGALYALGTTHAYRFRPEYPDTTAPHFGPAPQASFIDNARIGRTTAPVRLSWPACDDESAVTAYTAAVSTNESTTPIPLPAPTTSSVRTRLAADGLVRTLTATASDSAGNTAQASSPSYRLHVYQESSPALHWTGTWHRGSSTRYSGGYVRYTSQKGASVTLTFRGSAVAWVAPQSSWRHPTRGIALVRIDDQTPYGIQLQARRATSRRIIYSYTWPTSGTHTIRITAAGPNGFEGIGGPSRIDIDAILTL